MLESCLDSVWVILADQKHYNVNCSAGFHTKTATSLSPCFGLPQVAIDDISLMLRQCQSIDRTAGNPACERH